MVDYNCAVSLSMMKGVAEVRTNLKYPAQRLINADGAMLIVIYSNFVIFPQATYSARNLPHRLRSGPDCHTATLAQYKLL